ncbi:MAG: hypothetical protein KDA96_00805 [Planctomycetaceae bacterium]|nr:hypothetical protein [Planctomycetaceae bacterium]
MRPITQTIFPALDMKDFPAMLKAAAAGGLVAGCYGAVHDQLTFAISVEYFRNLKFHQFAWANAGLSERIFVSEIGFIASWWVGVFCNWFLARKLIPLQPRSVAMRQIFRGMIIVIGCVMLAGLAGYGYGLYRGPDADYSHWSVTLENLRVTEPWPFLRVAYIHNFGYAGAAVGLLLALFIIRPRNTGADEAMAKSSQEHQDHRGEA